MYKLIKLYTLIFVLWTSPNTFAKDCDEYNYPNGLQEGFVSDLSCSRGQQFNAHPIDILHELWKKKPTKGKFPVRARCPFNVFGVEMVRINFLASEFGYGQDSKIFQSGLNLTDGDFNSGFEIDSVNIDYPDRTIYDLYLIDFPNIDDPYVVWCYRSEAAWKKRKNTDKSGPDLKKIFIPYEATACILEKNLDKRPKDRRLVKFWCI